MIKHLSASSLTLYSDCSLKWKFLYKDKISKPTESIHLIYGSAIHKALEKLNLLLVSGHFDTEDIFQEYYNEWTKQINQYGISDCLYNRILFEMGLNSLEKYIEEQLDYEVICAEQKFTVPIIYPDKTEERIPITGVIDAIIKQKNKIIILDYKTSKEEYNKFKIDTSVQLTMYSYAFSYLVETQQLPVDKKEDYVSYYVLIKDYESKNGAIKISKKKVKPEDYDRMFYIFKTTIKGIDNNIFLPNYNSECKYCEYKKECLGFTGE